MEISNYAMTDKNKLAESIADQNVSNNKLAKAKAYREANKDKIKTQRKARR